jgi:hypothetical protein
MRKTRLARRRCLPGTGAGSLAASRWSRLVSAVIALACAGAVASSCANSDQVSSATSSTAPASTTTTTTARVSAASKVVWLCRPGVLPDPCAGGLDYTVVSSTGARTVEPASAAPNPRIDCFYVYPTISPQPGANSNLTVGPAESAVALVQASRFSQVCRVYAPMYRQLTLNALVTPGDITQATEKIAYLSLLAGWHDYMANYNDGRPVVLIGHSQGAAILIRLIAKRVDPYPAARKLLVSAILLGGNVTVPVGATVGGSFQHVPACQSATQTGCVLAYSSFLDPPPPNSLFGRVGQGVSVLSSSAPSSSLQVLCVNPTSLGGGTGALRPYFPASASLGVFGSDGATLPGISTPWVEFPGLYTATCKSAGGATWLQVNDVGGPSDSRPRVSQTLGPTWGLHLVDVNIALGNLVALVGDEAAAYEAAH